MLYDPKWEVKAKPKTKPPVLSLAGLIAWLETQPPETTHRVTGSDGIVHCVPAPGHLGCVLRWKGAVIA